MKIDNLTPLSRIGQTDQSKSSNSIKPSATSSADISGPATITHLSQAAQDSSQDIDQVRVNEIRLAISEGRLEINADKIADALIASVRDMLGSRQ